MATKKTGVRAPALDPKVADKLLDKLSTDNDFRRLFKSDPAAALGASERQASIAAAQHEAAGERAVAAAALARELRLGGESLTLSQIAANLPEEQAVETVEHDDFDVDEVAKAVVEDISSAQSAVPRAEDWLPEEAGQAAEAPRPAIISDQTGKQVAAAFHELSEALAARNRKSLDEMAEEMLRPMLQDWLDNNLPTLVERLVREEIERVARGAN